MLPIPTIPELLLLDDNGGGEDIAHRIRRLALGLGGDVGIGVQGEACRVMAKHTADGLHIHTVLEGQGGEGMAKVVEPHLG